MDDTQHNRYNPERAYVALPLRGDEEAAEIALSWCLERVNNQIGRIGLRVPQKSLLDTYPGLGALASQGVKVSLETAKGRSEYTSGPIIVYEPSIESLCNLEDEQRNNCIVPVQVWGPQHPGAQPDYSGIQPWVTAFEPTCLGGQPIEPKNPRIAVPVIREAMNTFTVITHKGATITNSQDRSRVADGLKNHLWENGYQIVPDDLLADALAKGWIGRASVALRDLASQVIKGTAVQVSERLQQDILQQWEEAAGNR